MNSGAQSQRSEREPRQGSRGAIVASGVALLVLAAASYGFSFIHSSSWGLPVALAIAALKAFVVISVFMEVRRETASVKLVAITALLIMALLVTLTTADVATRNEPALSPPPPAGGPRR